MALGLPENSCYFRSVPIFLEMYSDSVPLYLNNVDYPDENPHGSALICHFADRLIS